MKTTVELFKSLAKKHFDRAFPDAKVLVEAKIIESRMYIEIISAMNLNRNDTSRVLFPLFKYERFKDWDKHVRITCEYIEILDEINKELENECI